MRNHSFMDSEFNDSNYNPFDGGEFERNLVFIVMPFREDMTSEYLAMRTACENLGLNTHRADESGGSGFVLREITKYIERAEFIIFDLTYERPNVYYELGYAHGVGNEAYDILLVAKEETELHFDIAPLRVHFYRDVKDLEEIVSTNLKQMIKMTR